MKLGFIFCLLLFAANFHENSCKKKHRVSLFGSHFMSSKSSYKVFLVTNGFDPGSKVTVEVGYDDNPTNIDFTEETLNFHELDFGIPPTNIARSTFKMSATNKTACLEQSTDIIKTSESPMIFIQFNKPIYKSGDEFKFRIFVLNQKLLPYLDHGQMDIVISDAKSYTVHQFKNKWVEEIGAFEGTLGVLRHDINPGMWTISVNIGERSVSKSFEVQNLASNYNNKPYEYHNNAPELIVDSNSVVAFVDRKFYLTIYRKDQNIQKATISLEARFVNSSRVEINRNNLQVGLTDAKTVIMFDFQDDFNIKYPTMDMNLLFTVSVTNSRGLRTSVKRNVLMRHKGRNTIQITRKKYFKPEFKFPIKIKVKILDGKVDNSLNQLNVNIKYESKDKTDKKKFTFEEQNFQSHLKNGEIVYTLHPKADTERIHVNAEFADTEYAEIIERHKGPRQYMQVTTLTKSLNVGTPVQILARTTNEMEHLYLIVFGSQGIIKTANFSDAIGRDEFEFSLDLTDEMRPEARGIVFYVEPEFGHIVYDEFSLQIGFSISNWLEISANETAKPNEDIMLNITTENGSNVYLVGIDANSALINGENEVTRSSIYDELTYFINRKLKSLTQYNFDKFNGFFMEPLNNGAACSSFGARTNAFGDEDDDSSNDPQREARARKQPSQNGDIDNGPSGYFPEILFDHFYQSLSNEMQTIKIDKKFPDSATTWKIYGISIHPTKGFTVAKTQPEITIARQSRAVISIEIIAPSSIRVGEVAEVKFNIFNTGDLSFNGIFEITPKNGKIVIPDARNYCLRNAQPNSKSVKLTVPPGDPKQTTILVRSESVSQIEVSISAPNVPEMKKYINVEKSRELKKLIAGSENTFLIDTANKSLDVKPQIPSDVNNILLNVYGNLFGPALNGLEAIFGRKMFLDEDKVAKLAANVLNAKFLKFSGFDYSQELPKIQEGYAEAVKILNNIISKQSLESIWLAAFATETIINAKEFIPIDSMLVENSFAFINKQAKFNYNYNPEFDNRRGIGPTSSKWISHTASIVAVFLKNSNLNQSRNQTIQGILQTINANLTKAEGDPAKAAAAYANALNNDKFNTKKWLDKMARGYEANTRYDKHCSMYVEGVSFRILAKILINEMPSKEVEWLLKYRDGDGKFFSPYHTVLALNALYEYSKFRNKQTNNMVFKWNSNSRMILNQLDTKQIAYPNQTPGFRTEGDGLGYFNIIYRHKEENSRGTKPEISASITKQDLNKLKLKIKFKYIPPTKEIIVNLLTIEVELPSEFEFVRVIDNHSVLHSSHYDSENSMVVLYISKVINEVDYTVELELKENNKIINRKPSLIRFYDYYRSNIMKTIEYSYGEQKNICK